MVKLLACRARGLVSNLGLASSILLPSRDRLKCYSDMILIESKQPNPEKQRLNLLPSGTHGSVSFD